jgi:NAD dependent epimerase/dehydratase family enzyme
MSVLVLEGQKVMPESLLAANFTFTYPDLPDALKNILGK